MSFTVYPLFIGGNVKKVFILRRLLLDLDFRGSKCHWHGVLLVPLGSCSLDEHKGGLVF